MGGFFGVASKRDCLHDVFFGVDYHSHLGTRRGGIASWDAERGFQRSIHNIESTPFRTKFETDLETMTGTSCIGCISDSDPQPLLMRSKLGYFAVSTVGYLRNAEELEKKYMENGGSHLEAMGGYRINATQLVAALIAQKSSFAEGVKYAQELAEGTLSVMLLTDEGKIIAARDKMGRLPILIGKDDDGYALSLESFAFNKLGYHDVRELGPGEIVSVSPDGVETLAPPQEEMRICAFMWTYYGYPNSHYEGSNVECMRCRCGGIMAKADRENNVAQDVDAVCGVPDSGTAYAVGYANESKIPFMRPFIKYTPTWPRSFMPAKQSVRSQIAKMKMIAVPELIEGKKLLFVDDSIVRGTQLQETVDFLYENGAKEIHMRSACPPIMHSCKYINFTRSTSDYELIARRTILELEGPEGEKHMDEYSDGSTERGKALRRHICEKFGFASLEYQSLDGLVEAIGIDRDKICTYCWDGRE